ncbi:hypothetical protein PIB30_081636 [Stylosanthes scabra]|uniref:Uncharacterized protein n=1 Tax=Stylosanthes scabra TaxID=79078 RepID=A0ABU6RS11_9FABA|nr:hypothetical protein [Stylosanthes scabra]
MDHEENLKHLLQDPPEEAGTLGWMELTEPAEEVPEVEGGPDMLPTQAATPTKMRSSIDSSLEQWLGIATEAILVSYLAPHALSFTFVPR